MATKKAFVSGHNYIQDIHMEPGVYTVLMKVKSMYGDVCSFALFDGTAWTHYNMDTVQGQWKWAYVTFRILVPMTKINLISRNYSAGLPVYVVEPQIVAGNVPFDAGVAPEDVDAEIATAKTAASAAQTAANNAQTSANTANNLLTDIASDNKLTANEKQETQREWDVIMSEKVKNDTSADKFGVSKAAYGTAYTALNTYITPLLASLTTTSNITGTDFRAKFKAYYDARTDLLNAISVKAKDLADAAQTAANNAKNEAEKVRTEYTSDFSILRGKVESKVSQTDFNALGSRVSSAESTITQLPNQIALSVTESKQYTDGKVDAEIALRPTTDQIKAEFTIDPTGISMLGKKIALTGMVTFTSLDASAQATINNKVTGNDIATKLGYSSYTDMINKAAAGKTIINGGYINTNLVKADEIVAKILICRDSDGNIVSAVNREGDGAFRTYYANGQIQMEFRPTETNGVIASYSPTGLLNWKIGAGANFITDNIDSWNEVLLYATTDTGSGVLNTTYLVGTKYLHYQAAYGSPLSSYSGLTMKGTYSNSISPATVTVQMMITNGWYTYAGPAPAAMMDASLPPEDVTEVGQPSRYARTLMRYANGYIAERKEVVFDA